MVIQAHGKVIEEDTRYLPIIEGIQSISFCKKESKMHIFFDICQRKFDTPRARLYLGINQFHHFTFGKTTPWLDALQDIIGEDNNVVVILNVARVQSCDIRTGNCA